MDELEQLRQHDKEVTDLSIDQQAEIGRLWLALQRALTYIEQAERTIREALSHE